MPTRRAILITGGCRSGKSGHALTLASEFNGTRKVFVATCLPEDEEMHQRVRRHRRQRGPEWQTIEEPIELVKVIEQQGPVCDLMLIDCLTLWVSNLLAARYDEKAFTRATETLCHTITQSACPLIFVTNEVGAGIVPENPLARRFRDFAGWANQQVAAACSTVVWMVAGIALTIKPQQDASKNRQA